MENKLRKMKSFIVISAILAGLAFFVISCSPGHSSTVVSGNLPRIPSATPQGNSDGFCNWGFVGPKQFQCRGKTYVYGLVSCFSSGFTGNVFCEEQYSYSGQVCDADQSPDTVACQSMLNSSTSSPTSPFPGSPPSNVPQGNSDESCNWGFVGPKQFQCNGNSYVYGMVSCSSGFIGNVFCEEQYSYSIQACRADNSSETRLCYSLLPN